MLFYIKLLKVLSCISRSSHAQSARVVAAAALNVQMENICVITEGAAAQHGSLEQWTAGSDAWSGFRAWW